jgi:hypothetical protein
MSNARQSKGMKLWRWFLNLFGCHKGLKIFLDDQRICPPGWTLCRWPEDVIEYLKTGNVTALSLDHDLGDDDHGTGYGVLIWLEKAVAMDRFVPPQSIIVHSGNTVARDRMELAIASIRKFERENNQ